MNLAIYTLFRHEDYLQSCFFSVCILRPIRPVTMNKHLVQENFMEMSEIHCEIICYPYICTDSSRLVSVSHTISLAYVVLLH